MPHRLARPIRVLGAQRVQHVAMFGYSLCPDLRRFEVAVQLVEKRPQPQVEHAPHHADQHAVAGGLGDTHVEQTVRFQRLDARLRIDFHLVDGFPDRIEMALFPQPGRHGRDFAFEQRARLDQLQRPLFTGQVEALRRLRGRLADIDARPHAHLDIAFDLQRNERLAQRRPRHAQLHRQVALGGQARGDRELAADDQFPQLVADLAVQALRFDGLDGHGGYGYHDVLRR